MTMRSRISSEQLFVVLLALVAGVLLVVSFLPFEDIPNHTLLLSLFRDLRPGEVTDVYERPAQAAIGYSLYLWVDRLVHHWLSPHESLRMSCLLAAVMLPLAAGRLARALGGNVTMARIFALPLALSWPMKMGFVPYVLSLPALLFAFAHALAVADRPRVKSVLALAFWLAVAYVAHPFGFGLGVLLIAIGWAGLAVRRAYATAAMAAAFVPAALLFLYDLRIGAFQPVPGMEVTWYAPPPSFRSIDVALAHVFTRSFGITGGLQLLGYLPLLLGLGALVIWSVRFWRPEQPRHKPILLAAVLLATVGSLLVPFSVGFAYELGARIPVVGLALVAVLASTVFPSIENPASKNPTSENPPSRRPRMPSWLKGSVQVAAAVACLVAVMDVALRANEVSAAMGKQIPRSVSGRLLVARLNDCERAQGISSAWGRYDPAWHLWSYAVANDGVTPYLFGFTRYLPVLYRGDVYSRRLAGPGDWLVLSPSAPQAPCSANNLVRLLWVLSMPGYDGVLAVHLPAAIQEALAASDDVELKAITPGITLLKKQTGSWVTSARSHGHGSRGSAIAGTPRKAEE